ncbi:MAG: dihydroorotase [Spirochaetaceae bacterium]|jgi:dihydroorotase|nr:dihydroorotase [Spirochaetaceae bacterium]
MRELVLFNARLVDADTDAPGAVLVRDSRIAGIVTTDRADSTDSIHKGLTGLCGTEFESVDCRGLTLMPAFIDMHTHFRYPGQSEKETLETGLRAAVAGGYGAVVTMPNTKPPVSDPETARRIREEAAAYGLAEVFQTLSITEGQMGETLSPLESLEGIPVVSEDGKDVEDPSLLIGAFRLCARSGALVACHCEDSSLSRAARVYASPALSRLAEDAATVRNLALADAAGAGGPKSRIHICHVSTETSLEAVAQAKARDLSAVSCEVTPHHLALSTDGEDSPRPANQSPRPVNPPLRRASDRSALVRGIASGLVDVIATDHAPHTAADKGAGAPGFPGLETAFAVCNTALVHGGVITLGRLSELMSAAPARLLGLDHERGRLREGFLADLVLLAPGESWTVEGARFFTKGKGSPFEGMTLTGRVRGLWLRGERVFPFSR